MEGLGLLEVTGGLGRIEISVQTPFPPLPTILQSQVPISSVLWADFIPMIDEAMDAATDLAKEVWWSSWILGAGVR